MIRNLIIFVVCFVIGAATVLVYRITTYHQHGKIAPVPTVAATPMTMPLPPPAATAASSASAPVPAAATGQPVNTICPVCGMKVNPQLPTATWKGRIIGFGCAGCLPRFQAEPDRFGEAALKNQTVEP